MPRIEYDSKVLMYVEMGQILCSMNRNDMVICKKECSVIDYCSVFEGDLYHMYSKVID